VDSAVQAASTIIEAGQGCREVDGSKS